MSMKTFSLTKEQVAALVAAQNAQKGADAKSTVTPAAGAAGAAAGAAAAAAAGTAPSSVSSSSSSLALPSGQPPRTPSKTAAGSMSARRSSLHHKAKTLPRGWSMEKEMARHNAAAAAAAAAGAGGGAGGAAGGAAGTNGFGAMNLQQQLQQYGGFDDGDGDDDEMTGLFDDDDATPGAWDASTSVGATGERVAAPSSFVATAAVLSRVQPTLMSAALGQPNPSAAVGSASSSSNSSSASSTSSNSSSSSSSSSNGRGFANGFGSHTLGGSSHGAGAAGKPPGALLAAVTAGGSDFKSPPLLSNLARRGSGSSLGSFASSAARATAAAAAASATLRPSPSGAAAGAGAGAGALQPASLFGAGGPLRRAEPPKTDINALCDSFLAACRRGGADDIKVATQKLSEMRHALLIQGLDDSKTDLPGTTLRGKVWCALLGIDRVDSDAYLALVAQKVRNVPKYEKIRDDSFRTFVKDDDFKSVSETALIRVCNSFINRYLDVCGFCDQRFDSFKNARDHKCIDFGFTYCQGMNAISGPFLYSMPEVTAFTAYCKFITKRFPLYWLDSHIGAHAGCVLVERCLQVIDGPLYQHLINTNCSNSYVYAFACVKSLSAIGRPFSQLLKLWDFLIAFGPHFNVLCCVAQIIMIRDKLMATRNPKAMLDYRKWPRLRARFIIHVAMSLLPQLPLELYDDICKHTTDHALCQELTHRAVPT